MNRAITLNAQEVRAILAGELTQLWRPIAPKTAEYFGDSAVVAMTNGHTGPGWYMWSDEYPDEGSSYLRCPFGTIGDHLWVRETWAPMNGNYDVAPHSMPLPENGKGVIPTYRADHNDPKGDGPARIEWRSPVTMPQWASRLTLINESVDAIKVDDTWQWRVTFKRKDKSE